MVWAVVDETDRSTNHVRPWELARAERDGDSDATSRIDAALVVFIRICRALGGYLAPLLPAARIIR